MNVNAVLNLNLENQRDNYFDLLSEEDFDFRTKDINIELEKFNSDSLKIEVLANSILDLKIGMNAIIKSLEVIDKSLKI
ncbi:MAG: hypothetical protein KC589_07445 [Nanoarchaeota archaeon]|nr:hypothetical protein [Nanoarchaeota archaeon]